MAIDVYRKCTRCSHTWASRDEFLRDPGIAMIGYQVAFNELRAGLFLFNHTCGTTLAFKVDDFKDLYLGPVFKERLTSTAECPAYCLHQNELHSCPRHCECAFVREIMQIVRGYAGPAPSLEI